jgi:hypothetical protein
MILTNSSGCFPRNSSSSIFARATTEALGDRVLNGARPGERDMLAETELLLALDPDTLVADGKDEMLIFYQ